MTVTRIMYRHAAALEHVLVGCCTKPSTLPSPMLREGWVEGRPDYTALDRLTIALSREIGTPAPEVAREVGARLGWPVFDRELPARIAQEVHVPVAVVEDIDERRQSWLHECFESFSSRCHLSESRYFRHLVSAVRSLGEQGCCVIVGHGAEFLLPPHDTLRVRLVGERHDRIAAFSRTCRLDHGTAAHHLDQISREHGRFLHEHFHIDPNQPGNYDLVLNTSKWSRTDCADFILRALHHKATGHQSN